MKKWLDNILELSKKQNWSYKEFDQYIEKVEKRIIIYEKYLSNHFFIYLQCSVL